MPDLAMEQRHLEQSDRLIGRAEKRILSLRMLVERRRQEGRDVAGLEDLIARSDEFVSKLHEHRRLIVEAIDRARKCPPFTSPKSMK
jgi:hypothetical protein